MANTAKYRKKPVIVEAYQTDREVLIETLEGTMKADVGDYIITGVHGEQYPCKPDIFEETYEKVKPEKAVTTVGDFGVEKMVPVAIEELSTEPCDCVSREEALKKFKAHTYLVKYGTNSVEKGMTLTGIRQVLSELSPATPAIVHCKDCGFYEKATRLCTKHYDEKVFRQPNWFCGDAVKECSEEQD